MSDEKLTSNQNLKLDYLDDIMTKANYALMENEINCDEWLEIISAIIKVIKIKCSK